MRKVIRRSSIRTPHRYYSRQARSMLHSRIFFFSSRRRHTRFSRDWSSDVCSSDLPGSATCSVGGSTLACTISGLTNGTSYSFTVRAANAIGPGPASSPATATPVAPATAPGAPTGLTATAGNGQVGLTWTAPSSDGGSPITGYTATASPGGATCSVGGSTLGCTISGLTNGTTYSFTVRATNAVGTGPASAPATATPATVPGAPTGLTATPGNGQVALAWTAPATGGSPITGYTATASPGSATCSVGGSTLACTISGLTNGTSYSFTVRAANAIGPGPASSPATATPVAPATAPGAPTGLTEIGRASCRERGLSPGVAVPR